MIFGCHNVYKFFCLDKHATHAHWQQANKVPTPLETLEGKFELLGFGGVFRKF
jgi:hypothetical protein